MTRVRLHDNVRRVEDRIAAACERCGRSRSDVALVAVTKTVAAKTAALLTELALFDLGESRPQELWHKAGQLPRDVRWHLIGHLQRNKIERTLPLVYCIHAVDSWRLLEALEHEAARQQRRLDVLLEVKLSDEPSKLGFARAEVHSLVAPIARLQNVAVRGLMTMAPLQNAEDCRPLFASLRQLRDELRPQLPERHPLKELSMGMSNDFEIAIEEGATMIRLGTVLWEGVATG